MKKLLLLALIGICFAAWRSGDLIGIIGSPNKSQVAASALRNLQTQNSTANDVKPSQVSLVGIVQQTSNDPRALQAALTDNMTERTEADKLMNLLAHGKYE